MLPPSLPPSPYLPRIRDGRPPVLAGVAARSSTADRHARCGAGQCQAPGGGPVHACILCGNPARNPSNLDPGRVRNQNRHTGRIGSLPDPGGFWIRAACGRPVNRARLRPRTPDAESCGRAGGRVRRYAPAGSADRVFPCLGSKNPGSAWAGRTDWFVVHPAMSPFHLWYGVRGWRRCKTGPPVLPTTENNFACCSRVEKTRDHGIFFFFNTCKGRSSRRRCAEGGTSTSTPGSLPCVTSCRATLPRRLPPLSAQRSARYSCGLHDSTGTASRSIPPPIGRGRKPKVSYTGVRRLPSGCAAGNAGAEKTARVGARQDRRDVAPATSGGSCANRAFRAGHPR